MNEKKIRDRYQREEETEKDQRGRNVEAMNKFIEMLEKHEKSDDKNIRSIAENFEYIDKIAPNFTIFQSDECFFMHTFKAYQIAEDTDELVSAHEFGHAVLSIMNETKVPDNYERIILNAKKNALDENNREFFKTYIQSLSDKNNEDRTEAEKGPVSDTISSIFQLAGFRIGTADNECWLPSCHAREYYFDEEKNSIKVDKVFDEDFANFYALKVNNCTKELDILEKLFGSELISTLDNELENASKVLENSKEKEIAPNENPLEKIKKVISFEKESDLKDIVIEKEISRDEMEDKYR